MNSQSLRKILTCCQQTEHPTIGKATGDLDDTTNKHDLKNIHYSPAPSNENPPASQRDMEQL